MKWIKVSDRLPKSDYVDTFFVKQRMKDSNEDWFPGTCTYSGEWEISSGYEVIEWLDESPEVVGESELEEQINLWQEFWKDLGNNISPTSKYLLIKR